MCGTDNNRQKPVRWGVNMKKTILLLILLSMTVGAYDNASMSTAYRQLVYNDPIHAAMTFYEGSLGGYFYLALAIVPYIAIVLYTGGNMTLGSIWMFSALSAYGWKLQDIPQYVFYLALAVWVMSVLMKSLSPKYSS